MIDTQYILKKMIRVQNYRYLIYFLKINDHSERHPQKMNITNKLMVSTSDIKYIIGNIYFRVSFSDSLETRGNFYLKNDKFSFHGLVYICYDNLIHSARPALDAAPIKKKID